MREPTEMELRVAKELFAFEHHGLRGAWGYDGCEEYWIKSARAAIRAMREPTDDMLNEAHDFPFEGMSYVSGYRVGMYEAMIDAASPPDSGEG